MQKTNTMIDPKAIFRDAPVFSSFAVKDIEATRQFYGRTLGLDIRDGRMETWSSTARPARPCSSIRSRTTSQPSSRSSISRSATSTKPSTP